MDSDRTPRPPREVGNAQIERQRIKSALFGSPPPRIGRFVVSRELGAGGMGVVYRGRDPQLRRDVAIKLMRADRVGRGGSRQLLLREAQAMARLSHPNVVPVFEVDQHEGQVFVAMELVVGMTLSQWLGSEPRDWRAIVSMFVGAGRGLEAAHAAGLVHRDFKPDNVLIGEDQRPRVVDFGLVSVDEVSSLLRTSPNVPTETLSLHGTWGGTPAYMAPEQFEGTPADPRTDQYAFCLALWEALAGTHPFPGRNLHQIMAARRKGPRGSESLGIPRAVARALHRGLAVEPDDRYASMSELLDSLEFSRHRSLSRRTWIGLGLLGLTLVAGALLVGAQMRADAACSGSSRLLEGVWDEPLRMQVEQAILGTGLSYAPDTWMRVEQRLDHYTSTWVAQHTEVCEATSVRREQTEDVMDLRMACLSTRRIAVREAVAVLGDAKESTVRQAMTLVMGLPRLDRCDDVEALRAELPPPEDSEVAEQVGALRERLVAASSQLTAGELSQSDLEIEHVVREAKALDYEPLLADALLLRGTIREKTARYVEAEQDFEQAFLLAIVHGYDEVQRRAASALVSAVGSRLARPEQGHQWGRIAMAMAKRPSTSPLEESNAVCNIGIVFYEQGKLDEALEHFRRCLELREHALSPEHLRVADSLISVGIVLARKGRNRDAMARFERALVIKERALGSRHPAISPMLNNIGLTLEVMGDVDGALAHHRRALELSERAMGPEHPQVATIAFNIGVVLEKHGEPVEAFGHYQRSLAIREAALGPRHHLVASSELGLARAAMSLGREELATEHAERAVALFETSEIHPRERAEARFVLAKILVSDPRQRARALALVEQARDIHVGLDEPEPEPDSIRELERWLAEHRTDLDPS